MQMTTEQWIECVKTKFDDMNITAETTTGEIVDVVAAAMEGLPEEETKEVIKGVSKHVFSKVSGMFEEASGGETEEASGGEAADDEASDDREEASDDREEPVDDREEASDDREEASDYDDMPGLISMDYCDIQRAMYDKRHPNDVCDMIFNAQDDVVEADDEGKTLLHWAIKYGSPSQVVQTLINQFDGILKVADADGWLPLHYAAKYSTDLDVVKDIYCVYPEAILELNEAGVPPLLIARYGGSSERITEFLVEKMKEVKALRKERNRPLSEVIRTEDDVEPEPEQEALDVKNNVYAFDAFILMLWLISVLFVSAMTANVTAYSIKH